MSPTMKDNVVLITGGGGHIGRATGAELAKQGCHLAILDRAGPHIDAFCAEMTAAHGITCNLIEADLRDASCFDAVAAEVKDRFGRLDGLVNNAAFYDDMPGWGVPFDEEGYDAWQAVMQVNLLAPFFLSQKLTPLLRARDAGAIVNVASIYGVVGPDHGLYAGTVMTNPAAYAASKGGLIALSRWLSTVLAPDIRVNTVTPGGVERGQNPEFLARYEAKTPMGRMATEDDVAYAIVSLLDPRASYITGQNLIVDGGWTAW
ncbi:SDR family oxidoreductase [uncultured Roseobacter sp.]|uniref:SDR family NAD(P)-dependent oxidoreductase n=1 Tax=uncultured Roseobacter sp. TaxID=114847 RepID=UPI00261B8517|nr:SDR family oxidoreductase [uncultured Roseobacter sp.]